MTSLNVEHKNLILTSAELGIDVDDRKPVRWGLLLVLLGFGGFLMWSWLAPLDAGIMATGTVKVTSNRKTIQHLTGGTIDSILVREGDSVKKGQELVRLDSTQAISEQGVISAQYIVSKAVENRLEAERDGVEKITFDPDFIARFKADPRFVASLTLQRNLFETRLLGLAGEISILRENFLSAQQQVKGLQQIYAARADQLRFLQEELAGARILAAESYIPRNRVLELERSAADLRASQAENLNNIARTRSQVEELGLRILQREYDYRKEVQSQLTDIQKENTSLSDRLRALDYQVKHTVIRSPIDGMVQGINVSTIGGVIQPGFKIMDIVPGDEPLQVDAMIPVQAIDKMVPGLPVIIAFPAFNHAQTPNIPGRVLTISADRLIDEENKQPFYLAQIEVSPDGMSMLGTNRIRPGMPATVTIKTGERNLLSYLIKPLVDRIDSSFKEQ